MSDLTTETFKPLLALLVETPEYFTTPDLTLALEHLFTPSCVHPVQIGAFLAALHLSRIERRPEMLAAAAAALRARALKADIEGREEDFVVDIVGTGGDGHNTFNVSTTAAVVAAGAGARVCKHGSRASTSSSGSADLLQSLGCLFIPPTASTPMHIRRIPFTFILAPHYHPSLAMIAPYRKALPFRTMFNVLGPLINPAFPHGLVLGVAEPALGQPFAESLRDSGVERALVVCGAEHLDEISCAGNTHAWELKDGRITQTTLHPALFGLRVHPLGTVASGTPEENAKTFVTLLTSGDKIPAALESVLEYVLLNASALLVVAGVAKDYKDGVRLAREAVTSGKAWEALQTFKEEGERAAAEMNAQASQN
ncbi:anthranilate phosphoribosyltransferase, TrpD [Fomitiporia mediterranea MF3/22]|uniref:anthranilate phosphoribosyltransferase, TrpD n=1 Tax=Fomitiporia mediterranea (strain MF3/22) TaxID=694068 RepID=UPI0004407E8E|nr:anthranilate phosphoribosyltransferase, TrpD [Fomitiporia mediterranea MF3/22]EJC98359.1 anthranilate phosphoribosyltransferase, TrpD [Fomitiporia mediterranea MF3/22]